MLFFQKVLFGIYVITFLIGVSFLFIYYKNHKRKDFTEEELKNHKLNLMLGLIFSIGSVITGIVIPFIG